MDSGVLIIILIFFFAFLSFSVGIFCHFCFESGGGGRNFATSADNIYPAATALYTKRAAQSGDATEHNCRCSNKFKGRCTSCEGDSFVDDGELGSPRDFTNFGGDRGFDFPGSGGNNGDPMRGFLGNGSAPTGGTSALDQPDHNVSSYGTTPDQY